MPLGFEAKAWRCSLGLPQRRQAGGLGGGGRRAGPAAGRLRASCGELGDVRGVVLGVDRAGMYVVRTSVTKMRPFGGGRGSGCPKTRA